MKTVVSLLRAVNLGRNNRVKMEDLRAVYASVGLKDVQTYVQSGNVVFTSGRDPRSIGAELEHAIERRFGFRTAVILRTLEELRDVVARNPFASRADIETRKLLVTFLAEDPGDDAREKVRAIRCDPEELVIDGRQIYIHFPLGMGHSKLQPGAIEKLIRTPGTGRNWNTVTKLLEIAEGLSGRACGVR